MSDSALMSSRIVVVDHIREEATELRDVLSQGGFENVLVTGQAADVVAYCLDAPPDLVLLRHDLPGPGAFEVMRMLWPWSLDGSRLPVLLLEGKELTAETREQALAGGASDFADMPIDARTLLARVRNLLELRRLQLQLRDRTTKLESHLDEHAHALERVQVEVLQRLALAAEYRDDNTDEHTQRVGRTAALLAQQIGLPQDTVKLLRLAAPLHDLGKIGIPDEILLKPGKLSAAEYEVTKTHVTIGGRILSGSASDLLKLSEQIALSHHERWDGAGYPQGNSGEEIPLVGRIVAVADVFDILTHERPYKESWSIDAAVEEIRKEAGSQFDPGVVEAFDSLDAESLLAPIARKSGVFRITWS